jgi:photosystem II stability/assembly factor-like uncharacterized protein
MHNPVEVHNSGKIGQRILRFGKAALALLGVAAAVFVLMAATSAGPVSSETLMSKLHWRLLGPFVGGRVVAIAGVPSEPDLFYMGTTGGGIWKSTDYGIKWENISDGHFPSASPSIGAIAVAPSNPNIIYVGSGESDIRNDMIPGDGMYKSTDAGKTWHAIGLRDTHTISAIVVDPQSPDVVYVSSMGHAFAPDANRGVFKSTDGGQSWQKVFFVNDQTGAIDLVMDPSNSQVLYAAMWQAQRLPYALISGGPGSGLYKSTDGGAHWANLSHMKGFPEGTLGRIGVSVSGANSNIVYAVVQAAHGGVFRSDDGGQNWTRTNRDWALRQRAFYYMAIYADPKDANTIYAPQVDALWVSHDGGKTFTKLHTPHGDNHIVWINPNDTKILLEGNDGGATVSTDGGKTWSDDHNQPTGQFYHINIDSDFPYHVFGAQQDEGSTEGPSASPGGMISPADWQRVAYGESTYSVPQPGNSDITYGSGYYSILIRADRIIGELQGISPWPDYQEGAASAELKYRFGWTHPILFSPTNPKELLVGAQCVLRSDDYGRTWTRISPDLTRNAPNTEAASGGPINVDASGAEIYPGLSALAVSPQDGNTIWAGSDDGMVHVTTDGGKNWRSVRPPELPRSSWVSSIEPSHTDAGTAYLTARRYMWDDFHPYVFKTTDTGRHWTEIINGLPEDSYVFDIRQDPHDPDLFFLGAKNTIYVSLDAGDHWEPLTLNLPTAQVRDIAINTRQGEVAIATHGRAFWALDNLGLLEQLTKHPRVASSETHLFAPQTAWLTHAYGGGGGGFRVPNAGQNPAFGATVLFHIPSDYDGQAPVTLSFSDSQGKVIRTFNLHLAKKKPSVAEGKPTGPSAEHTPFIPTEIAEAHEKNVTGITAGMDRFQWDLRYPNATEVKGFEPPVAAGGEEDTLEGPEVVPGTYTVTLDYDGKKSEQHFAVALDPRIHTTTQELDARLALQLKIHNTLETLNKTLNRALAVRDKLQTAVSSNRVSETQAGNALSALNDEIGKLVQLRTQSSEGTLLYPAALRSQLAYLGNDIGLAYTEPNAAQYAVYEYLNKQAQTGEQELDAAISRANKVL